jgi:hypothetical protein
MIKVSVKQLRARKPHVCNVCNGMIRCGQEYIQHTEISGGFRTDHRHVHCDALVTAFQDVSARDPEYSDSAFRDWIIRGACDGCENLMVCEAVPFPFGCRAVIEKVLPETVRGAAILSLEEGEHGE